MTKVEFKTEGCGIKVFIYQPFGGCLLYYLSLASLRRSFYSVTGEACFLTNVASSSSILRGTGWIISNIITTFYRTAVTIKDTLRSNVSVGFGCLSSPSCRQATLACSGILVTVACVGLICTQRLVWQAPLPVLFRECRGCCNRKGHVVNWVHCIKLRRSLIHALMEESLFGKAWQIKVNNSSFGQGSLGGAVMLLRA